MRPIKTEPVEPLWKQPAPIRLPDLPQVDPSRKMEISRYYLMMKTPDVGFKQVHHKNLALRMVILNEIEKTPQIWNNKNTLLQQKIYPQVAIEVYKRTGTLLHPKTIQKVFKVAKDCLRSRLREAITRNHLNIEDTEKYLWKWEYYPAIRFFRQNTQNWESKMRIAMTKQKDGEHIVFDIQDDDDMDVEDNPYAEDDDVIWDKIVDTGLPPSANMPLKRDPTQYDDSYGIGYRAEEPYQHQPEAAPPCIHPTIEYGMRMAELQRSNFANSSYQTMRSSGVDQKNGLRPESCIVGADILPSSSVSTVQLPFLVDFQEEMAQITYQAIRIVREQPDRLKILRKALFDTVLAFDQNDFNSVGEVFKELAAKNTMR